MNKTLITDYINKIKKEDIHAFANNQGISLKENELILIYNYIKNDFNKIIYNPNQVLNEIENKVSNQVYKKILELYNKYKFLLDKLK